MNHIERCDEVILLWQSFRSISLLEAYTVTDTCLLGKGAGMSKRALVDVIANEAALGELLRQPNDRLPVSGANIC